MRGFRPATGGEILAGNRARLFHVTFDDAFRSVEHALPVLERLGIPATVFVCSSLADSGAPLAVPELADEVARLPAELATMTWEQLRELTSRGIEIGSHTATHPHLTQLSDTEIRNELTDSRRLIEDHLGRSCNLLAYPYGEYDSRTCAAAPAAGYQAAFGLSTRDSPPDRYALPRVGIWRKDRMVRTLLKTSLARTPLSRARAAVKRS
jgi:peptidoglycan/xylan/chitin deacetylase (PgdA/CDA1 family)